MFLWCLALFFNNFFDFGLGILNNIFQNNRFQSRCICGLKTKRISLNFELNYIAFNPYNKKP